MNKLSQFQANGMARKVGAAALLIALTSAPMFAQDPFSSAASGAATTVITVVRWLAIIVVSIAGTMFAIDHEHNLMKKVVGMTFGLIFALFATPIVTYIQGL